MRPVIICVTALLLMTSIAGAQTPAPPPDWLPARPHHNLWDVTWQSDPATPPPAVRLRSLTFPPALLSSTLDRAQPVHAAAVEHSDAYVLRRKIHKYASFATLPLFAAEIALGQSLYDGNGSGGARGAHGAVGAGIAGLFAVNTVTGAWNLFGEGRKDPNRTARLVHGLLMMAADVGILATTVSAPKSGDGRVTSSFLHDRGTHRNLAIASISTATAGYLMMFFVGR